METTKTTAAANLTLADLLARRAVERAHEAESAREEARIASAAARDHAIRAFGDELVRYFSPELGRALGIRTTDDIRYDEEDRHNRRPGELCHAPFTLDGEQWRLAQSHNYGERHWIVQGPEIPSANDFEGPDRFWRALGETWQDDEQLRPAHDRKLLDALAEYPAWREESANARAHRAQLATQVAARQTTAAERPKFIHIWSADGTAGMLDSGHRVAVETTLRDDDGARITYQGEIEDRDEWWILLNLARGGQALIPHHRIATITPVE